MTQPISKKYYIYHKLPFYKNYEMKISTFLLISTLSITSLNAQFGSQQIISTNANNDGFIDVISASYGVAKIAWYKNEILAINEFSINNTSVFPNPTNGLVNISSQEEIIKIEVFDILGRLIKSNQGINSIDISNLNQGVYILKFTTRNGFSKAQKIIRE